MARGAAYLLCVALASWAGVCWGFALKSGAPHLLAAGKLMGDAGEAFIGEQTNVVTPWSSAGARIRNAGDCFGEAGAKARFKTGAEGVSDAFRTAAEELLAAGNALSEVDEQLSAACIAASESLEKGGYCVAVGEPSGEVGACLVSAAKSLEQPDAEAGSGSPAGAMDQFRQAAAELLAAGNAL